MNRTNIKKKKIIIINGPNLNLLGKREPKIYGAQSFDDYFRILKREFRAVQLDYFQSNSEGELIDKIQEAGFDFTGIVFNPGAYTHTSIALMDAIAAIPVPVIEVHLSNIQAREPYRSHSYTAKKAKGIISGLGLEGYRLAIQYLINKK